MYTKYSNCTGFVLGQDVGAPILLVSWSDNSVQDNLNLKLIGVKTTSSKVLIVPSVENLTVQISS